MKNFIILIVFIFISITSLYGDDVYMLKYSGVDHSCTLTKNTKDIPLFDKRFKMKEPKTSYTCSAMQKEQYNYCKIDDSSNTTAQVFSYGVYEYTNLVMVFKNPTKSTNSFMKVICTKKLVHK
jgi:hypothetical protein